MTTVIQIGNSDNSMTQSEWAHYVQHVKRAVEDNSVHVHFFGCSSTCDPWQNCCWVADVLMSKRDVLESNLTEIRKTFRQDSVAVIYGSPVFI